MKRKAVSLLLAVAVLLSGCGSSSHEEAMDRMVACFEEMTAIMSTIQCETSAELASVKLEAVKVKMDDVQKSMEKLGPPSADEARSLQKKFESEMQTVLMNFGNEMMRIMAIPGLNEQMGETLASLTPS